MPVFSPPQSPIPNVFNFAPQNLKKWRAALAKAKAGTSNARILCLGDSTTQGVGSNGASTGNLTPLSYPSQLAGLFSAAGINAHWNSFCGDSNSGQSRDTLDSRIALSGNMVQYYSPTSTYACPGGGMLGASSSTSSKLAFTPTVNVDTFKVWYVAGPTGTFSMDIGGSGTTNINVNNGGVFTILSSTIAGSLASNTLNIKWVSGAFFIVAVEAWDSSKKWVSVMNAGWSGSARQTGTIRQIPTARPISISCRPTLP